MKKTQLFIAFIMISFFILNACQKKCIQCKIKFSNYVLYKGTDTIIVEYYYNASEDYNRKIDSLIRLNHYTYLKSINDTIYHENYCGKKEIDYYKTLDNAKKNCYPL
jgi:hypothetical protein